MAPKMKQTTCRHCGADIEGAAPYRRGQWRDSNGTCRCPSLPDDYHAPIAERLTIRKDCQTMKTEDGPVERMYFLIAVDVDRAAILADNPPEDVGECIASELRSHLDDTSVRGACGIVSVTVLQQDDPDIIEPIVDGNGKGVVGG